jgi:hypothetical protein
VANPGVLKRRPARQRVRPVVQRNVDAMDTPAILRDSRVDYLYANRHGALDLLASWTVTPDEQPMREPHGTPFSDRPR